MKSLIQKLKQKVGWRAWSALGAFLRVFGDTTVQTRVLVKRGGDRLLIHPDCYDDFEFSAGDQLTIRPLRQATSLLRTPDHHLHIRRSDGKAIRVPPSFAQFSFRKYQIPEHLIVLTGAGSSSWEWISKGHLASYMKFIPVASGMSFLEIGCGIGRDALQLIDLLGPDGRYVGIDVTRDSIVWCRKNISRDSPNFEFHHFDAQHELYNPLGTKTSLDFALPVPDKSVDRIALGSVFTHLFEREIVHYMKEVGRVLKPAGLAYATFFLYSDDAVSASRRNNMTPHNLRFEHPYSDGCYINDANYPTGAVAFTDEAIRRMIRQAGLRLTRPYLRGAWSGLFPDAVDGQDVAILASA